jgi:hypothetical protein
MGAHGLPVLPRPVPVHVEIKRVNVDLSLELAKVSEIQSEFEAYVRIIAIQPL